MSSDTSVVNIIFLQIVIVACQPTLQWLMPTSFKNEYIKICGTEHGE